MTYNELKNQLPSASVPDESPVFDLVPKCVESKIIYAVGAGAANFSAVLSSIMNEGRVAHSRAICSRYLEPKDRFLLRGTPIAVKKLLASADRLTQHNGGVSAEGLYFLLALDLLDAQDEFLIIEVSGEFYGKVACSLPISPYAVVFCDADAVIKCPAGTREVIALTHDDNFDYISSARTDGGARISYTSQNKLEIMSVGLLGAKFFYNTVLYESSIIDRNNIELACLAVECATVLFSQSRLTLARGVKKAKPTLDPVLHSLSPTVLLKLGDDNVTLPKENRFKTVTEDNFSSFVGLDGDTVFCGSREFLDSVKMNLKNFRKRK
ncbi:MAG: hypothetical protein ACI3XL_01515 [Eubacteriales bacterium]